MLIYKGYAIGMSWREVEKNPFTSRLKFKKEFFSPKSQIVVKDEQRTLIGFGEGLVDKGGSRSLAYALANSPLVDKEKKSVFFFHIEEEKYGVVGVLNGMPLEGFDVVETKDFCFQVLEEFYQLASLSGNVVVYSEEIADAKPFSLDEFISKDREVSRKKEPLAKPLMSSQKYAVAAAIVIGVIYAIGAGISFTQDYFAQAEMQKLEAERLAALEARNAPEAVMRRQINQLASSMPEALDLSAIWKERGSTDLNKDLWFNYEAICNPTQCNLKYRPSFPFGENWDYWADNQEAVLDLGKKRVEVKSESYKKDLPENPSISDIFGPKSSFVKWYSSTQKMRNISVQVSEPKEINAVNPTPNGERLFSIDVSLKGPLWMMEMPLQSSGLRYTDLTIAIADGKGPMEAYQPDGSLVTLKGIFYVYE